MKTITKDRDAVARILRQHGWFGELPVDLQHQILDGSVLRDFRRRAIIFAEDQPPVGLFAVIDGEVSISRLAGTDNEVLFHVGGPGMWFGDLAVLTDRNTAVTARAHSDVEIMMLTTARFRQIVEKKPDYYRIFALPALQRAQLMFRTLAESQSMTPEQYLRVRLADFAEIRRGDGAGQQEIELTLSQTELAQMVGTTRQTINAILKKLEADGLIRSKFKSICIADIAGLRGDRRRTGL